MVILSFYLLTHLHNYVYYYHLHVLIIYYIVHSFQ